MGKLKHYADSAINSIFKKKNKEKTPLLYYWTKRYLFTLIVGLVIIGVVSILWIRHNALANRLELTKFVAQEIAGRAGDEELENIWDVRFPFMQDRQDSQSIYQPMSIYIKAESGEVNLLSPMQDMAPNSPKSEMKEPAPNNTDQASAIEDLDMVEDLTVETITLSDNRKASVVIAPILKDDKLAGNVYIIQPHDQLRINTEEYQLLGLLLTGLAILGWLVIYSLSKKLAKPVEEVANAAQNLMNGNYDIRLNEDVQEKELHQLVLSFNEMTKRLQTLEGLRTQLLAGVTHELKTPITSISALVQAVNDNIITDDRKKEFLAMSLKEAKRLQSMVEDLLDFNSFSAGSIRVHFEKTNIQAAVKEIIYQWEIVHADALKDVKVTYTSMEKQVFANIDSVRLQQIVVNLLNNSLHAIKGKADAELSVSLKYDNDNVLITVEDNGYGIPVEEQHFIFERFYRGKNKKDVERGLGLGLPYSLLLAKALGGLLSLQKSNGSTTIFLLKLPLWKEESN